jgi:hypothetical protein
MSRKAILRNIRAYLVRLLLHLIKNHYEARLTNSWAASIRYSVLEIQDLNKMDRRGAFYLKADEWEAWLDDAFEDALYAAAAEVGDGHYTPVELAANLDRIAITTTAQELLTETYRYDRHQLSQRLNEFLRELPGGIEWERGGK